MMSEESDADAWGQLVCITDIDSSPVLIKKEKFTIGRARGCDLSLTENKLVSSCHCYIQKDDQGKVWLYDSSTNGTLLNMSVKLSKGECRELNHGDEFFVVYKKNNEECNVGYMFQDIAKLKEEEEEEEDDEPTLEYSANQTIFDEEVNVAESPPPRKRTRRDSENEPVVKHARRESAAGSSQGTLPFSSTTEGAPPTSQPSQRAADAASDTDKDKAGDAKEEKKEEREKQKSEKKAEPEEKDAIAEALICIICQEILHDCISLQPCMHSFCSGCYSGWMPHSDECPSCRIKVDRINKNHIVNNLVEAYLMEHPEKRRPEEDLKELDAKNKITRDMLYTKQLPQQVSDSSEEYSDSDDSESEQTGTSYGPILAGTVFGFGTPVFGNLGKMPRTVCRQCPNYVEPPTPVLNPAANPASGAAVVATGAGPSGGQASADAQPGSTATADQPSTSGEASSANPSGKRMPTPPQYQCVPNQNHVLCQCCLHPMPDRRAQLLAAIPIGVQQQCAICYRSFCHAYWGCRKASCNGCLDRFRDMNFGEKALTNLILENTYESKVLKDYLKEKKKSAKELLQMCITMMEAGMYSCTDQARLPQGADTYLCYPCAWRNFRSLAYQYRADIPQDQLPAAVTSRPDCYWGKNCRTQRNKPAHARKFNHICDQSRT